VAACCRAIGSGGGLNVIGTGATLFNMTNCTAKSNQAGSDGGVVSLTGGAAVLSNNLFLQNTAGVNGGALAYTYQCFAAAGMLAYSHTFSCWHTVTLSVVGIQSHFQLLAYSHTFSC